MKLHQVCLTFLGLTLWVPLFVAGGEWSRFRGPNGTGQSDATNIPATWTNKDYKWRVKVPGISHSSPVVWGEQVFVTSSVQEDGTRNILCLSTVDGSVICEKVADTEGNSGYNAASGKFEDMVKAGVIDPTKVTRAALQNASSVSTLLLTSDALIADKPKDDKAPAGGGDEDMY